MRERERHDGGDSVGGSFAARGGEYEAGSDTAAFDMQKPYLELILGFMGFTRIASIEAQPTLMGGPDVGREKLDAAIALLREKARSF